MPKIKVWVGLPLWSHGFFSCVGFPCVPQHSLWLSPVRKLLLSCHWI